MAAIVACSHSPNEPSDLPATLTLTDGRTQTVPGTDLRLTLVSVPFNCPPNASCLPAPWGQLTARAGSQAPVEFPVAGPLAGPQPVRQVDVYRLTVLEVADAADPYSVRLRVERN